MIKVVQDHRNKAVTWGLVLVLAATLAFAVGQGTGDAKHNDNHQPANKVAVAGNSTEVGEPDQELLLLETTMRNAASKSLVLQVSLECSILTELRTVGSDTARAESTLEVWVEVNDRVIAVGDDDGEEGFGEVTFCNREYQRTTNFHGDDEDHIIDDFIRTKQAHGFNWVDLETGHGIQEIEVWGRLTTGAEANAGSATADVAVGNRTLVVEPVDTAHDETRSN